MQPRMPTYFLSHGGGPWPWLKDLRPGMYDQLETSLLDVRRELGQGPKAVLMISGHWEANRFLVSSACVYRKTKHGRSDDEVRRVSVVM